jgi:glycosyltransferase involved in cell wall biosynthesis
MKTVCFFGSYNQTHRNNSLLKGLRAHDYEVLECRDDSKKPLKYFRLFQKHRKLKQQYDVMIVGFPNHGLMLLARLLTRKPIIFDPFISLYNTIVEDRKQQSKYSLKSMKAFMLDTLSMRLADRVLSDTASHGEYYSSTFGIPLKKFVVVPVGADEEVFAARNTVNDEGFAVKFYGTYSPLQGVQYIVRAAKLLEDQKDIHFYLLGHGQTLSEMLRLAKELEVKNVTFIEERIPVSELSVFMESADVSLGIFGGTVKSNMVIPHKVYDALALGRPVLTGDTEAANEFFTNTENILLCKEADAEDLAQKVLSLRNDTILRTRIAKRGRELLLERFTPKQIVRSLIEVIETL